MKPLIHLFFLLIAGAASVYGQSAPPASSQLPPALQGLPSAPRLLPIPFPGNNLLLPGYRVDIPPGSPLPQLNTLRPQNPIRILQPDNMPCLVLNLTRVERMPIQGGFSSFGKP